MDPSEWERPNSSRFEVKWKYILKTMAKAKPKHLHILHWVFKTSTASWKYSTFEGYAMKREKASIVCIATVFSYWQCVYKMWAFYACVNPLIIHENGHNELVANELKFRIVIDCLQNTTRAKYLMKPTLFLDCTQTSANNATITVCYCCRLRDKTLKHFSVVRLFCLVLCFMFWCIRLLNSIQIWLFSVLKAQKRSVRLALTKRFSHFLSTSYLIRP